MEIDVKDGEFRTMVNDYPPESEHTTVTVRKAVMCRCGKYVTVSPTYKGKNSRCNTCLEKEKVITVKKAICECGRDMVVPSNYKGMEPKCGLCRGIEKIEIPRSTPKQFIMGDVLSAK